MQSASPRAATGWLRALGVLIWVVVLDQLTKHLVREGVKSGERHDLIFGFDLVNVRNRGIAFGLFTERGLLLPLLTFAALGVLVVYFALHATRPLLWLATGLMLGGAVGNLVDRARLGAVTDFLDLPFWPAFNLADVAITAGVLALLVAIDPGGQSSPRASRQSAGSREGRA